MKRVLRFLTFIVVTITLLGCSALFNPNYPTTTFWVTNSSDKTINFKASIIKYNSMGPYEMTLPFTVNSGDTVLFRRNGFRKNANPTAVYSKFIIFPVDNVNLNNPKDSTNWIKSLDIKGKPQYIFDLNKK